MTVPGADVALTIGRACCLIVIIFSARNRDSCGRVITPLPSASFRPHRVTLRVLHMVSIRWTRCSRANRRSKGRCMTDAFTFGIEEEYFLVDARDQVGRPRRAAGILRRRRGGDRRPGLARIPAAADRGDLVAARQHGGARARTARSCARPSRRSRPSTASPFSPPARIRPRSGAKRSRPEAALRHRDARSADDRPAQHAVRPARPCRAAGSGRARRRDVPNAALSAAVPRALDLLAVLAIAAHRAEGLSARRL